jgi:hypothetical protein
LLWSSSTVTKDKLQGGHAENKKITVSPRFHLFCSVCFFLPSILAFPLRWLVVRVGAGNLSQHLIPLSHVIALSLPCK